MSPAAENLVVLDGRVTDEKLAELLALQGEHPTLDFKQLVDPNETGSLVEFAKDVGAFQVAGGYIIAGVDGHGVPNGSMDGCDRRLFDEANLTPKLLRYLPEGLTIHPRVTTWQGHTVVSVFIAPHPDGYAVFKIDGQYERNGDTKTVFRAGEIFWRDGTRSVRISQRGWNEIIERKITSRKAEWMAEQQELRRREREELEAGHQARGLADSPVGTMNLGLSTDELRLGVLELARMNTGSA